ncbi:MAG: vanadium-dependent haloperoxidase [Bacteroidia bacterium]|nr:vanadium-dependent haloperoxidase [Bacteroidia bacterium]
MKKLITSLSLACLAAVVCCTGCRPAFDEKAAADPELLRKMVMSGLTEIIIYDIFTPPVASRIYAYTSIAAYEVMAQGDPAYESLAGQLNGLTPLPAPPAGVKICYPLAAMQAYLTTCEQMIFSLERLDTLQINLYQHYRKLGIPEDQFKASVEYGTQAGKHILAWASQDNYKQTRTFEKYTVKNEPGRWVPTPPTYIDAVEPHWNKIRPMVLDSAAQFKPDQPPLYDLEKSSAFYQQVLEVYETTRSLSPEQRTIADFWDCNPFAMQTQGHFMFANKKITPGGHWMGITAIATRGAGADFSATAEAFARVSISLFEGFISCWDEKYRSNLIRPETVINENIDPNWKPMLQTPPFPEYTSGHSVISASAATALTNLFGENYAFVDSTEVPYGVASRSFPSFYAASDEAAVSRMYGGIHYKAAIEVGKSQGRMVGRHVSTKLKTRVQATASN